jgi:hypothetical protein
MVEADNLLKLLPISISDIYKVFEHIDMLSKGIRLQPYTVMPTLLGSDFGVLWVICGVKRCNFFMVEADSHLKLLFASISNIYKVFEHIGVLSMGIQ